MGRRARWELGCRRTKSLPECPPRFLPSVHPQMAPGTSQVQQTLLPPSCLSAPPSRPPAPALVQALLFPAWTGSVTSSLVSLASAPISIQPILPSVLRVIFQRRAFDSSLPHLESFTWFRGFQKGQRPQIRLQGPSGDHFSSLISLLLASPCGQYSLSSLPLARLTEAQLQAGSLGHHLPEALWPPPPSPQPHVEPPPSCSHRSLWAFSVY